MRIEWDWGQNFGCSRVRYISFVSSGQFTFAIDFIEGGEKPSETDLAMIGSLNMEILQSFR